MTAGSPTRSVRVPAASSSSMSRISPAGKPLSSINRLRSLPRSDAAPAITTRSDSLPSGMSGGPGDEAMPHQADYVEGEARDHVAGSYQHKHDFRVDDDQPN